MEKWLILTLIFASVVITVYGMKSVSDLLAQKASFENQDYIITKLDQLQANRTKQFLALMNVSLDNQNTTIENQKIIKGNQELLKTSDNFIKNNTLKNLNLTLHNRAMLDDSNDRLQIITALMGINDTHEMMEKLNLTHTPSPLILLPNGSNITTATGKISSFMGVPIEILNGTN